MVVLGSGAAVSMEGGLEAAVELGRMADQYQVEAVQGAVEDVVVAVVLLTVESCGSLMSLRGRRGSWRWGRRRQGRCWPTTGW